MYYTIGHKETYDKNLAEHKAQDLTLLKMGVRSNYIGGIVFPFKSDAEKYLRDNNQADRFKVYGVKTTKRNVYLNREAGTLHLVEDAEIVEADEEAP